MFPPVLKLVGQTKIILYYLFVIGQPFPINFFHLFVEFIDVLFVDLYKVLVFRFGSKLYIYLVLFFTHLYLLVKFGQNWIFFPIFGFFKLLVDPIVGCSTPQMKAIGIHEVVGQNSEFTLSLWQAFSAWLGIICRKRIGDYH